MSSHHIINISAALTAWWKGFVDMWKPNMACFLSDHRSFKALIICVTQHAEKTTPVVIAADLFVSSLWEHAGMRLEALGSCG